MCAWCTSPDVVGRGLAQPLVGPPPALPAVPLSSTDAPLEDDPPPLEDDSSGVVSLMLSSVVAVVVVVDVDVEGSVVVVVEVVPLLGSTQVSDRH